MKTWGIAVFILFMVSALAAQASDSFRLVNGKLITAGLKKYEVIALAGEPLQQDVEKMAVDDGVGQEPVKRETLTYHLSGAIGGMYWVVLTLENNVVVAVESKQEGRL